MTQKDTAVQAGDEAAQKKAPERVEVTLAKPHTHAGKELQPGEKIKVTARQREWLQGLEVVAKAEEK